MNYNLTVTAYDINLDYDKQLEEYQSNRRYNDYPGSPKDYPSRIIEVRKLIVEITEEEFKAIKKAVLEVMK